MRTASAAACVPAPEVFRMGDDGVAHGSGIPDGQLEAAQEARDGCPVSAITIEE